MGCWGMGIMQSDDALDAEINIMEVAGFNWDEKDKKKIQESFITNFDKIVEVCNQYKEIDNFTTAVYWQVLAYHGMKNGVPFSEEQQQTIVEGITQCSEYKKGKQYSDREELYKNYKTEYCKEFGEDDWKWRAETWGEYSMVDRIIDRTKNIDQLVKDFKNYTQNNFKPFERKEKGLMETMTKGKKNKM